MCNLHVVVYFVISNSMKQNLILVYQTRNAAFRLARRSPHCCFDDDICITAQAPLAAEE